MEMMFKFRFQSHAGSIEAVESREREYPYDDGFNPTLVRLRLWLKRNAQVEAMAAFQSHAGSIEARRIRHAEEHA